jgi:transcriptional regulator with XRE-family HTH domain
VTKEPELAARLQRAMKKRKLKQADLVRWLLDHRGLNPDDHKDRETCRQAVGRWYRGESSTIESEDEARALALWLGQKENYLVIPGEVRPIGVQREISRLDKRIDGLEARVEAVLGEIRGGPVVRAPMQDGPR